MKTWAILFAFTCLMEGAVAEAVLIPKVDNFVFFLDQSGSMYMRHGTLGEVKMSLAKKILKNMNGLIPEWGFTGALCLFSPFHMIQQPATYLQTEFGAGLDKIRNEQEIFGRPTQLSAGLRGLDQVLAQLNGVTALILISDGETNQEHHELLMEVLQLRINHLQAHFYILSLADRESDRKLLQEIAQTGNGTMVEAGELLEGFALEEFTNSVFLEDAPEKAPVPTTAAVPGLQPIVFDSGESEITARTKAALDEAVEVLSSYNDILILVEGHTDSAGLEETNQLISERRAKSVRDYLIEKKIPEDRIKAMGYGQLRPAATNDTAEGREMNRRVEIKIVK
jgi:OOP family OmpA-OmpF porin